LEVSNPKEALHHLSIAAQAHNDNKHSTNNDYIKRAKYQLALCYLEGIGCKNDLDSGLRLLESVAKQGDGDAAYELSEIYNQGKYNVPVDKKNAIKWKQEAVRAGNQKAKDELTVLYSQFGKEFVEKDIAPVDSFVSNVSHETHETQEQENNTQKNEEHNDHDNSDHHDDHKKH